MAKRRGDGEGSIYLAKDGRWRAEISVGYAPTGKAIRKVLYARTRAEVANKLKKHLQDQQLGHNLRPQKHSVAAFLREWLTGTVVVKNRPHTIRSYRWIVERHLVPGLGRLNLDQLTPQHVQQFLSERHASGLSATTVKHIRATLRAALSQAERWGTVHRNVAKLVTTPPVSRYEATVLTPAQSKKLLAVLQGHRLEAVYVTALLMGLRRGELLGLRWSDIDLETSQLSVRKALSRIGGQGLVLGKPKSARAVRNLRMPRICTEAIGRWRGDQQIQKQWAGTKWREQDFIFTNETGGPLDPDIVSRSLPAILAAADLPLVRLHDLRHSCATTLLSMGVHPKLVQETLGHSTFQLTMDTYSHMLPSLRTEVADKLDEALTASTPTAIPTKQADQRIN